MPARIGATTVHPFIPYEELPARQRRRIVIGASLRTIATIVVVVAIYFRIPMDRAITATTVIGLVIGVLALFAIIAWQIREIMRSEHPVVRAVEALAFAIPVYVLLFATIYFLMAHAQSAAFGVPLSRTDAMYFSATVFTHSRIREYRSTERNRSHNRHIPDDAGSGDHRHRRARSAQRRQGRPAAPRHARGARTRSGAGRESRGRPGAN